MFEKWGVHRSVWHRENGNAQYAALTENLECDCAVIGGGITGLSTALELQRAGLSVIVLTEGRIGAGATGDTTAHLTFVPDLRLRALVDRYGLEKAAKVIQSLKSGLGQIAANVARHRISCDFQMVPARAFAESAEQAAGLRADQEAALALGLDVKDESVGGLGFDVEKIITVSGQAQMHPLSYLHGLASNFLLEGGRIFEGSRVVEIKDGERCEAVTAKGSVKARDLVLATHSPLGVYLSLHTRVAPYFTYAMAVRLRSHAPEGLYWDSSDPYFYLRPLTTEDRKTLVVGGCDHKTGQEAHTLERYQKLENYVRARFDVTDVTHYWGQEIFESVDGLPFIGKIPRTRGLWTATGFAGCGMTFGAAAGNILTDLICERENAFAGIFDPARVG
ncbi:MAG: FAD-binding oxidoreductase, partial [Bdellovibrionia bacterium]